MSHHQDFPTYPQVKAALSCANAVVTASEAHGLLCALICTGATGEQNGETWSKSVFSNTGTQLSDEDREVLTRLFECTKQKLYDMDFSIEILLPEDSESVIACAEELSYWCQGFSVGLQLGQARLKYIDDPEVKEYLDRIQKIAELQHHLLNVNEEDGEYLIEVVEYVRLGALLVFAELHGKHRKKLHDSEDFLH